MQKNIIWFRSDLRRYDNPALSSAVKEPASIVKAVFLITEQQWLSHGWGNNKIGFVLRSIISLKEELNKLSIPLDIIDATDFKQGTDLLVKYLIKEKCNVLFFNLEYELNEAKRDKNVINLLNAANIKVNTFDDQTIIHLDKIKNLQGKPYAVFSAFKKNYLKKIDASVLKIYSKPKKLTQNITPKYTFPKKYQHYLNTPIQELWPAGEKVALKVLKSYCSNKILHYAKNRDFPSLDYTSKLSPYLACGSLTSKVCLINAMQANEHSFTEGNTGVLTWISEIIWRDFYKYILYHYPNICKLENFNPKYNKLPWSKKVQEMRNWQNGTTGIPIIDAAMRQLVTTGWMHNRLRMVVGIFLTKNLLIDWRVGEKFFASHLIDMDFSANNGGWQWCASTGANSVPYFRVFNPITQSKKFDPEGTFIKKYCPELKSLSNKIIHNPSAHLSAKELAKLNYPCLQVDIAKSKKLAIEIYKNC